MVGNNIFGNLGQPINPERPNNNFFTNGVNKTNQPAQSNQTRIAFGINNKNDSFGSSGVSSSSLRYGLTQLLNSPVFRQMLRDLLNYILSNSGNQPQPQPTPLPTPQPNPTPGPGPVPPIPTPQPNPTPGPGPVPPLPDPQPPVAVLKPAIYLYPTCSTKVKIRIDPKGDLIVDIPKYNKQKGWFVMANPDGSLLDLQPELTSKESIKKYNNKFGLDYALESQETGIYPYLYWEGLKDFDYEYNPDGWLVKAENVESFLESKLEEIGFNKKEKHDFLSYWTYMIQKQLKPFYKLSFFFTEVFEQEHPMQIFPQPDSIFRVMLQIEGLEEQPKQQIKPQQIEQINRNGFFVLEWGGYFVRTTIEEQKDKLVDLQKLVTAIQSLNNELQIV